MSGRLPEVEDVTDRDCPLGGCVCVWALLFCLRGVRTRVVVRAFTLYTTA